MPPPPPPPHIAAASCRIFLQAASGAPDKPFENIQDPSQTHEAYRGGQQPPGSDPDVERELKPGKNVPTSAGQAKEELQYVSCTAAAAATAIASNTPLYDRHIPTVQLLQTACVCWAMASSATSPCACRRVRPCSAARCRVHCAAELSPAQWLVSL
jgi:hypothetical protein